MSLVTLLIVLVAVGFVLWAINTYVPMDAKVKNLLNIAIVIILVIWLLEKTGLLNEISKINI